MPPQLPSGNPFLVRVAGPRADLAAFEVRTVAHVLRERGRLIVATGDAERLAAVSHVYEFLGTGSRTMLPFDPRDVVTGTYSVRADGHASELQALVWRALDEPRVRLASPETELHAFVDTGEVWWGRLIKRVKPIDFRARDVFARPFARSIGMPARAARCLVNLAGITRGDTLLDPFCGTGSLLIEAALLGARVYGSDIGWPLVRGTRTNLEHFGLRHTVERHDATQLHEWNRTFDAIVTDVPYGRSASLHGADPSDLHARFLESASAVVRPGGSVVVMAPKDALPLPVTGLRRIASFDEYLHGTLTRTISVFRRPYEPSASRASSSSGSSGRGASFHRRSRS